MSLLLNPKGPFHKLRLEVMTCIAVWGSPYFEGRYSVHSSAEEELGREAAPWLAPSKKIFEIR